MDLATKHLVTLDLVEGRDFTMAALQTWLGRSKAKPPVWPVRVVVPHVIVQNSLQLAPSDDQQVVEAFAADRADPTFREGVGVRRLDRGQDHGRADRSEDVIEGRGELRVPVANQVSHRPAAILERPDQIARLLSDPRAGRVGRDSSQVHSSSAQLDEEEDRQLAQPDGVDGEEVTGEDTVGLLAQERPPARGRPGSGRRRANTVGAQYPADRGSRHPVAESSQLALDPLVSPAAFSRASRTISACSSSGTVGRPGAACG